jgi:O-antigen/teichoic acid export membrane protein
LPPETVPVLATADVDPIAESNVVTAKRPGGVVRGGTIALASRAIGLFASLATGIITARALGPTGKGTLAFLSSASALLIRAGSVGLDGSFTHFYLTRRRPLADCIGAVVWIVIAVAGALVIAAEIALLLVPRLTAAAPLALAAPFFAATPAYAVLFVSTFVFFALGRETFFGVFDVGYRAALLLAFTVALIVAGGGVATAVWVQITVSVAFATIAAVAIGRSAGWRFPLNRPLVREMLGYGSRYYAYGLLRYALCYEGILIAGVVLNDRDTGLLSVGAMLGEAIVLFAGSINLAFYPAVSTAADPRAYTARTSWRIFLMSIAIGGALAIVAHPLIRLLYGPAFLPSVAAYLWMLPGFVLLSAEQVVSSYFATRGMPQWVIGVLLAGTVGGGALAVAMGSIYGVNGVAAAVGAAQVCASAVVLLRFARSREEG